MIKKKCITFFFLSYQYDFKSNKFSHRTGYLMYQNSEFLQIKNTTDICIFEWRQTMNMKIELQSILIIFKEKSISQRFSINSHKIISLMKYILNDAYIPIVFPAKQEKKTLKWWNNRKMARFTLFAFSKKIAKKNCIYWQLQK